MAWITPPVFVAIETLIASKMNQLSSRLSDLWVGTTAGDMDYYSASDAKTRIAKGSDGDRLTEVSGAPAWVGMIGAKISLSTFQTIANTTSTAITFDTEVSDSGSFWTAGDPTKLTVPYTGNYLVIFATYFGANATGQRLVSIVKNGATVVANDSRVSDGATYSTPMNVSRIIPLTEADYITAKVYQDSGGNLNVTPTVEMQIAYLGS